MPGCIEIHPKLFRDSRGSFVKTFHEQAFATMGLNTRWTEEYYSVSRKRVLRGLHFQLPPHDHHKLVYCTAGEVLDAVVDLRRGSATYGHHVLFRLSAEKANIIYIAKGMAHGFLTLSESATVVYKVSSSHAPKHDTGVLWNSAGIPWNVSDPILSERDRYLPPLGEFTSPFIYREGSSD